MNLSAAQIRGIIIATIIAIVLLIAIDYAKNYYKKRIIEMETGGTILRIAISIARTVVCIIYVLFILTIFKINITSVIAGLGVASVVVGVALQDTLRDVFSGLNIVANHFYSIGDVVEYDGKECRVVSFNLSTTKLGDNNDHSIYSICNRDINSIKRLANRYDVDIPFPYELRTKEIEKLLEIMKSRIEVMDLIDNVVILGLERLDESCKLYRIRIFCKPQVRCEIARPVNAIIADTFDENNISIPYNTLDVYLKK